MSPAEAIRIASAELDRDLFGTTTTVARFRGVPILADDDGWLVSGDDSRLAARSIPELMNLIRQDEAGRRLRLALDS